jgi:hypothetical protein
MSRDLIDEILGDAGNEVARRRGEVVEFPLVSGHLKKADYTEPPAPEVAEPEVPEGVTVWPEWVEWPVRLGKYLGFLTVAAVLFWAFVNVRRELIYASAGRMACSADNAALWVEEDPGSDVPRLKDALIERCAKAYVLF